MDMNVDPILRGSHPHERGALCVTSRHLLDELVKESEIATGQPGRRFFLPGDTVHTFLVTLDGHGGYGVQRFKHAAASPAEFMTDADLDLFLSRYAVMTWPIGHPGNKRRSRR